MNDYNTYKIEGWRYIGVLPNGKTLYLLKTAFGLIPRIIEEKEPKLVYTNVDSLLPPRSMCTCVCHSPHMFVLHMQPCCVPDSEEEHPGSSGTPDGIQIWLEDDTLRENVMVVNTLKLLTNFEL